MIIMSLLLLESLLLLFLYDGGPPGALVRVASNPNKVSLHYSRFIQIVSPVIFLDLKHNSFDVA
jgi:hypothetical protein